MVVRFEKATQEHIELIHDKIRQDDCNEVMAASGCSIYDVLTNTLTLGGEHIAGFIDNNLVCIFGIVHLSDKICIPYLLGTDLLNSNNIILCRNSKRYIKRWKKEFEYMVNFVDKRNVLALKWLSWLGFTIHEEAPYGVSGLPFNKCDLGVYNV